MRTAIAVALAFSASTLAAEPINFNTVLPDQDGVALTECADRPAPRTDADCKERHDVTLGIISMRALIAPEPGLAMDESLKRGALALRVYKCGDCALKAEEIADIKKLIAKNYSPLVVVRTFQLLDPGK